jgi:hypothetical protein
MVVDWNSDVHVRLDHGQWIALPRRTPTNQFSMQVHPELAGAKCLSGKHLNAMGLGFRHPLLPISDAPASKFGKQLRGFRTFLRKAGASQRDHGPRTTNH